MDKMLDENTPIYMQIMEKIRFAIISGELLPGGRMDSVRELASAFSVNPNTMQRALFELEREGLLCSERTAGRFVTKDISLIENKRYEAAEALADDFVRRMRGLGYEDAEIIRFFQGKGEVKAG